MRNPCPPKNRPPAPPAPPNPGASVAMSPSHMTVEEILRDFENSPVWSGVAKNIRQIMSDFESQRVRLSIALDLINRQNGENAANEAVIAVLEKQNEAYFDALLELGAGSVGDHRLAAMFPNPIVRQDFVTRVGKNAPGDAKNDG